MTTLKRRSYQKLYRLEDKVLRVGVLLPISWAEGPKKTLEYGEGGPQTALGSTRS